MTLSCCFFFFFHPLDFVRGLFANPWPPCPVLRLWEEAFDGFVDSKPRGPTAVAFDASFAAATLSGLAEHSARLRLEEAAGGFGSEPFRGSAPGEGTGGEGKRSDGKTRRLDGGSGRRGKGGGELFFWGKKKGCRKEEVGGRRREKGRTRKKHERERDDDSFKGCWWGKGGKAECLAEKYVACRVAPRRDEPPHICDQGPESEFMLRASCSKAN